MSDFVSAIIVAAGSSTRMGTADSKQLIPLLGKPAIAYTLSAFESCDLIREIILVCREQDMPRIREIADTIGCQKLTAMVPGGESRTAYATALRLPIRRQIILPSTTARVR